MVTSASVLRRSSFDTRSCLCFADDAAVSWDAVLNKALCPTLHTAGQDLHLFIWGMGRRYEFSCFKTKFCGCEVFFVGREERLSCVLHEVEEGCFEKQRAA